MPGLTFPQNPQDGQTISFSFQHTGGSANDAVITKTWSWNASRNAWVSNYSNTQGGGGGGGVGYQGFQGPAGSGEGLGSQGFQGLQGFQGFQGVPGSSIAELGSISGNSKETGFARWEYTVFSADFNGSNWVITSPSVTANNLLEIQNTGTTAYGISVTGNEGITLSGFTGFEFKPVPNGTIVELIQKGGSYFFSAPNPIDGIC